MNEYRIFHYINAHEVCMCVCVCVCVYVCVCVLITCVLCMWECMREDMKKLLLVQENYHVKVD